MISFEEVLAQITQAKSEDLIINGNFYTNAELDIAERILRDSKNNISFKKKKPNISLRRAYIVILQEKFFNENRYPENLNIKERIYPIAVSRFSISQRNKQVFETASQALPKDPCLYFEDNGYAKRQFRESLKFLLITNIECFENTTAKEALKLVFEEIKIC